MKSGIEAINFYCGRTFIDVKSIFKARDLSMERFGNLMLEKKAVSLPCEDTVSFAVNAAKPIIDQLSPEEKDSIKMVITSSESGIDFGKSISTYVHDYLGLSKNCRLFEVKQACYGGTAAFQMANSFILSNVIPGAKVLVIASDIARAATKYTYAEPSQAVGAVAMLISANPKIFSIDAGESGFCSFEVMDACRPMPDQEVGSSDLSLLSYLDCLAESYKNYKKVSSNTDFKEDFKYLVFHAPFGGMVKGAHRKMMRDIYRMKPIEIEEDFTRRVLPSLYYCSQIGNVYSAGVFLSLLSLINHADIQEDSHIGLFSYGSGCSSEFYSGILKGGATETLISMHIDENLESRYELKIDEYEKLLDLNLQWMFGIKDKKVDFTEFEEIYNQQYKGKGLLVLKKIDNYHKEYIWS